MKRASNSTTLKEAIERLLHAYKLKGKMQELDIVSAWEELMGSVIARRTREIYVKNKVLYIHLDSSVLREELQMGKSSLIRILNEKFGEGCIDDVVLK
jgi:predicted nucleic acid-binding Zn ribbon protein